VPNYKNVTWYIPDMASDENSGYNHTRRRSVYQSMDQPLSHYYIASSHNTYIESHQLKVWRGSEEGERERGERGRERGAKGGRERERRENLILFFFFFFSFLFVG
jgi:hypothetical protein